VYGNLFGEISERLQQSDSFCIEFATYEIDFVEVPEQACVYSFNYEAMV
jgi:hypothetical protein